MFIALAALCFGCQSTEENKNIISEGGKWESVKACQKIGESGSASAERYVDLIDSLEGDRKCALITAMGNAKVEAARGKILEIIKNSPDDFTSLCSLWALEKLEQKTDSNYLQSLWSAAMSKKPRSKDYALDLLAVAAKEPTQTFLKEKLKGGFEEKSTAIKLVCLRADKDLFADVAAAAKGNSSLSNAVLAGMYAAIDKGQFKDFFDFATSYKVGASHQKFIIAAAVLLGAENDLRVMLASLKSDPSKSEFAKNLEAKIPQKAKLIAMDTAILDLPKNEKMNLDAVKFAAKLGYCGIAPMVSTLQIGHSAQSVKTQPDDDKGAGSFKSLYTKMRQANCRVEAVYVAATLKDGAVTLPYSTSEILGYCSPMGAPVWMSIDGVSKGAADEAAVVKFIDRFAAECAKQNLDLVLYHHQYFYLNNIEQLLNLLKKCSAKNVYATFNLCHEQTYLFSKKIKMQPERIAKQILDNLDKIKIVTICGIDETNPRVENIILPLGKGTFDVKKFVDLLYAGGFKEKIFLQGYNTWKLMPVRNALAESMSVWKSWYK